MTPEQIKAKAISDLSKLEAALQMIMDDSREDDSPALKALQYRIASKNRIIEAADRFLAMMSKDDQQMNQERVGQFNPIDRSYISGIHDHHYHRLNTRSMTENDYWLLIFRKVLLNEYKHPSVTCSLCSGIIDLTTATVIPEIVRRYMTACICDTFHMRGGWNTPRTPISDDSELLGFARYIHTKYDQEHDD